MHPADATIVRLPRAPRPGRVGHRGGRLPDLAGRRPRRGRVRRRGPGQLPPVLAHGHPGPVARGRRPRRLPRLADARRPHAGAHTRPPVLRRGAHAAVLLRRPRPAPDQPEHLHHARRHARPARGLPAVAGRGVRRRAGRGAARPRVALPRAGRPRRAAPRPPRAPPDRTARRHPRPPELDAVAAGGVPHLVATLGPVRAADADLRRHRDRRPPAAAGRPRADHQQRRRGADVDPQPSADRRGPRRTDPRRRAAAGPHAAGLHRRPRGLGQDDASPAGSPTRSGPTSPSSTSRTSTPAGRSPAPSPGCRAGVLRPIAEGRPGAHSRYDWHAGRFAAEPAAVPPAAVLLVEGCGSSPRVLDPWTTLRIWVEAPPSRCARSAVWRATVRTSPSSGGGGSGSRRPSSPRRTPVRAPTSCSTAARRSPSEVSDSSPETLPQRPPRTMVGTGHRGGRT